MKQIFLIAAATIVLSSCNKAELEQADKQNDSLVSVVNERNSAIDEFVNSFNDIERNLDSVSARQNVITIASTQTGEFKKNQKDRINSEILAINELMDQNRKKIDELNRKIKNSANKNAGLVKAIATLNNQLAQKDLELADLNARLALLNTQVEQLQVNVTELTAEGNAKSQTIADATTALHTAYYVIGKSKELQDANLIDRKGGLLGMGKTSKVTDDLDNSKFTRIDYTQTTNIAVNSKMKIISNHPTESYVLNSDEKDKDFIINIVITNPEKFWSASKYLVIVKS